MLFPNGWMNETLTAEWVKQIWGPPQTNTQMLVWDIYKCHISASMKNAVQNTNTITTIVPGDCKKLVQPADVNWNASFKAAYRNYMTHGWPVAPWSGHMVAIYVHLQKHLGFNGFWKPGTQSGQK